MKQAEDFLKNLVPGGEQLKATIKEGAAALKPYVNNLEVVHIKFDDPAPYEFR